MTIATLMLAGLVAEPEARPFARRLVAWAVLAAVFYGVVGGALFDRLVARLGFLRRLLGRAVGPSV